MQLWLHKMNIDVFWQEFAVGLNIAGPLDFVAGLKFKAGLEYATGLVIYSKCCGDIFFVRLGLLTNGSWNSCWDIMIKVFLSLGRYNQNSSIGNGNIPAKARDSC